MAAEISTRIVFKRFRIVLGLSDLKKILKSLQFSLSHTPIPTILYTNTDKAGSAFCVPEEVLE